MSDHEIEAKIERNSQLAQATLQALVTQVEEEGGDIAGVLLQLSLTSTGAGYHYVRREKGAAEADRWWNIFCISMANAIRGKQRFLFQTEPIPDDPTETPPEA